MNMFARLVAGVGAVLLWAYARACRERNLTQRRPARANLLRTVSTGPGRTDRRGDRAITVDITPDTPKLELDSLRVWWSSPDDELRRRFDAMAAEAVTKAAVGGGLMDELRERIAQALYVEHSRRYGVALARWSECHLSYYADADAVIAALGLREVHDEEGHYWQTPWERIEEDG